MKKLLSLLALAALSFVPLRAFSDGLQVADAKIGKGVQDRAITEEASTFAVNDKVYLVLKLTGGPSDPIKARWMGFWNGAGIHGTDETWSIGHAASHGCVRMRIPDVIQLYSLVPLGTPVYVG